MQRLSCLSLLLLGFLVMWQLGLDGLALDLLRLRRWMLVLPQQPLRLSMPLPLLGLGL